MCQWQSKIFAAYQCQEPPLPDSEKGYCIFHEEQKDAETFNGRIQEKLDSRDYDFRGYYFLGLADFQEVTFERNAYFWEATFEGEARFHETTFEGNAYFKKATFKEYSNFYKANFEGYADFREATFEGNARFEGTSFKRDAGFNKATFKGEADFKEAAFKGYSYFNEVIFKGDAVFDTARCERLINFVAAKFKRPHGKETACRLAKTCYQRDGQYDQAGDYYYEERVARLQQLPWWSKTSLWYGLKSLFKKFGERIFLWSTCGYGEKPKRIFVWAASIITLSAVVYYLNRDILSVNPTDVFSLDDAFYLSVVTFVTLGFGGPWYPAPESWIKYVVMLEGFIGAFFIALFVMTFGRRMMR